MNIQIFSDNSTYFAALNSPFVLLTGIELFVGFIKLNPYHNQVVNRLAGATLGVYLIHDNEMFRPYLWRVILKNAEMYTSPLLIVHALVSVVVVYLVCSCIDLLRQNTVERIFLNIMDRHLEQTKSLLIRSTKHVCQKVGAILTWYYE